MLVQTENTKILCLKYSLLPSYLWEALLSARAYLVAAAVASLITGSATAFAEGEDGGPPVTAFPDGFAPQGLDLFSEGHGFGDEWTTLNLWASRGKLTSLGRGEKFISSPDVATPPGDQDGARPDYDLNADYSSSTLDDSRFPATVTDFGSVELAHPGWMDALRRRRSRRRIQFRGIRIWDIRSLELRSVFQGPEPAGEDRRTARATVRRPASSVVRRPKTWAPS